MPLPLNCHRPSQPLPQIRNEIEEPLQSTSTISNHLGGLNTGLAEWRGRPIAPIPRSYSRVSPYAKPVESQKRHFYSDRKRQFACLAELVFDFARLSSRFNERFTYDPKCVSSLETAKCRSSKESPNFCKCPFEVCSGSYLYLLKCLEEEICNRLSETFISSAAPHAILSVQLGNICNPLQRVLEGVQFDHRYIYDFLYKVNLSLWIDKYLTAVEIKTSLGITVSINLYAFCNSSLKYANMLGMLTQ